MAIETKEFPVIDIRIVLRSLAVSAAIAVVPGMSFVFASARADEPKPIDLAVYPPDVRLDSAVDKQSILAVVTRDDGVTIDVTDQAEIAIGSDVARLDVDKGRRTIFPVKDGETQISVKWNGFEKSIPAVVANSGVTPGISWHLDVMPVFMRAGCNTGSCHGAARGKDGFRLSLFGFDPKGDYTRVTREIGFRRINLAVPEDSLLLEKCVGAVPHTGGKRFDVGSEYYNTLLTWLKEGAKPDAGEPPVCTALEIYPPKAALEGEGTTQRFIARAKYSDGTDRDVCDLAAFQTNNETSAPVTADGMVAAAARGEAFIMARFDTHTVGSQTLVLPKDADYKAPAPSGNYVDELIGAKLTKLRMYPSELCTDEEFLRRATLDVAGQLPTEAEYQAFMSDADPNKRVKKLEELVNRKEFSEIWAMKWSELLMVKSGGATNVDYKSAFLYYSWLSGQIAENRPLDEMVRDILASSGGTFTTPQTNFYQIERDNLKTAENVAQVFMGIRTQCAQCHNHPFDRWTMDDYYGFAAFFSQIGRKEAEDYRETIVFNRGGGEVKHPVDGRTMTPQFLGGEKPDVAGKDRRQVLAEWLTAPENPYFAPNVANRVWAHFFGQGIVNEVDDIRVSNPASNPELFQKLGEKLVEYKYDFKRLVVDICSSNAYQRSTLRNDSNRTDERNFAHANVRRIPAEMLLDCISQVTETKDKFRGLPAGARAVQIADGNTSNYFLTTFGRAERETVCACEATTDPSLSQALHLLNGDTVDGKIRNGGVVKNLMAEGLSPEQVIETLFIRTLTRRPTPEETIELMEVVKKAENPQQGLEDAFWSILNSREFLFNH